MESKPVMALFLLWFLTLEPACEDTHVLSGSFRSDAFVSRGDDFHTTDAEWDETPAEGISLSIAFQDLSLELVLGHFGPEVAGLAKFHKIRGVGYCPCAQIRDGRYWGRRFTFKFTAHFTSDCLALGILDFQASLALRQDGTLDGDEEGFLDVTPREKPGTTERFRIRLNRDKQQEDLNALDLSCEGFTRMDSP